MKTIPQDLADYSSSLTFTDLSPQVIHETKRRLIDSLGCAIGAYRSNPGIIARRIAGKVNARDGATLIGADHKSAPELATFVNGVLIRYLDYNDTYLSREPAHPSDNISAALSMAETMDRDAKALITAIVLGYEIQLRLCDAASLRERGWDHVAYVSISSALVASKLMSLDIEKTIHAINLSITPNIPLRQTRIGGLSMWKGCAAANAARNGVFAAILAREGMTGPAEAFEGEKGLIKQVTGPFTIERGSFGGSGNRFKILDSYIKFYPAEYHTQAAIEAALELKREVDVADIEKIDIETYDVCIDITAGDKNKWHPQTRETADHSLPYCVAVALHDGSVDLRQFSEETIRNPAISELLKKVRVKRNTEYNKQYPNSFPCLLEIRTKGGRQYRTIVTHPKGHPKNPLTDKEVEEKFERLSEGFIGHARKREIIDRIWGLERLKDLRGFMTLIKTMD